VNDMGRIRNVIDEIKYEEEPMVMKKEEKSNGNGVIPVKIDSFEVYYSTTDKTYFAVAKVEGKRIRFESVK